MKPVAGYFRVSHARDGMQAPEIYHDEIERYCSYRRLELAEVFSDIDYSAFRGARPRPGLERLVSQRHHYAQVIVPKLSRFGRSMKDLIRLFDIFDSDGIALVFLDMNIDSSTSQGRLLRNVMSAFAEYESDVKSDYSRANVEHAALAGRPHGPAPYGYRRVKGQNNFAIQPQEATIVRQIFSRYVAGESTTDIAADLYRRRVATSRGAVWTRTKITNLLHNVTYAGFRAYRDELVPATWPAIIKPVLWEEAQKKLKQQLLASPFRPRQVVPGGPGVARYLFSGLIACGVCGRNLVHAAGHAHHPTRYRCVTGTKSPPGPPCSGGGIAAKRLESLVLEAITEGPPDLFAKNVRAFYRRLATDPDFWSSAPLQERQQLLRLVIDRIVLMPRKPGSGRGEPRGRQIRIVWRAHDEVDDVVMPTGNVEGRVCDGCGKRKRLDDFRGGSTASRGRSHLCRDCRGKIEPRWEVRSKGPTAVSAGARRASSYLEEWRRFRAERHI